MLHAGRASPIYGEFFVDFLCTARTYRYSVRPFSALTLVHNDLYGTAVERFIWRGNIRYVYIHTPMSDYLPFTRFFPLPKLQCYWKATSFNDRPFLNTTTTKRIPNTPAGFR